jgi:type IV pilus assembly protein PilM
MSLLSIAGKKDVLGVDIGSSMIKVLELKESSGQLTVLKYGQKDISSLGLEEKSPEEQKAVYIKTLKEIISANDFSTKNAAISIAGSSVIVRFVKFPKMDESDLQKTLQFEAEPHIPFDIQEVDMDTQIIGDVEDEGQTKMETVLVASKKDTIREKIEIIEKAGLTPSIIDVDAFALENIYEIMNSDALAKMVMLVNIGASTTTISIVDNGISKVVRDLYTAGNSLTRAIQNNMQVSTEKAEEIKKQYGLSGGGEEESLDSIGESEDIASQVYNHLYPVVRELNSEIQRSIDYFSGQLTSKEINVEKIILTGGTALLKGLPELIGSELRMPVEVSKPLENADTSAVTTDGVDMNSPALAVVSGLALRRVGDHK